MIVGGRVFLVTNTKQYRTHKDKDPRDGSVASCEGRVSRVLHLGKLSAPNGLMGQAIASDNGTKELSCRTGRTLDVLLLS